jgi:hypothetical protein
MNLSDHIVAALRREPMTFAAIHDAMNAMSDHDWTENMMKERIAQLLLHKTIVRDADGVFSVPPKETDEPLDSPPSF